MARKELPWGWVYQNKEFTEKIQNEFGYFLNAWIASRKIGITEEYAALKSLVLYIEDARKLCVSKGEYFTIWFDEIIADKKYIQCRKDELSDIETNFDEYLKKEQRKHYIEKNILPNLKNELLSKIKNNPGILRSELCKMYDDDVWTYVTTELYYLRKESVLLEEKCGRTYKLFIKEG